MEGRLNIWVSIGTALLAFIGALLGTALSGYFQEDLWEKQASYEEKRLILGERIELIDRVSKIINKAPIMRSIQSYGELQAEIAQLNLDCERAFQNGTVDDPNCMPQERLIENVKYMNGRAELNAEFAAALQLATVYFGPQTIKAAEEYAGVGAWWEAEHRYARNLLQAMQDELQHFE